MNNFKNMLIVCLGLVTLNVLLSAALALPVCLLWDYCLVGAITGVQPITLLQAWGISILCGFLFRIRVESK